MLLVLYPLVIELPTNKQWQKTIGCGVHVHGETFAGSMFTDQAAHRNNTGLGAFELRKGGLIGEFGSTDQPNSEIKDSLFQGKQTRVSK